MGYKGKIFGALVSLLVFLCVMAGVACADVWLNPPVEAPDKNYSHGGEDIPAEDGMMEGAELEEDDSVNSDTIYFYTASYSVND